MGEACSSCNQGDPKAHEVAPAEQDILVIREEFEEFHKRDLEAEFMSYVKNLVITNERVRNQRDALGWFEFNVVVDLSGYELVKEDQLTADEMYSGFLDKTTKKKEYKGILMYHDGSVLEGHFHEGDVFGRARKILVDGSYIEGVFENGKLNGKGKYVTKDGYSYEGEYESGVISGEGKEITPEGFIYQGQFANGVYSGQGTLVINNDIEYSGQFKDGELVEGEIVQKSKGKYYKGKLMNGKEHGYGEAKTRQGEYKGDFQLGEKHGQGFLVDSSGKSFEGHWKNGMMEGEFAVIFPGKSPFKALYEDGKFKKKL